jgi:organic radical activating enzyme
MIVLAYEYLSGSGLALHKYPMDPKPCLLPDHGLFISPRRRVTACCVSVEDSWQQLGPGEEIDLLHPKRLEFQQRFHSQQGPKSCDRCRNEEHYDLRESKSREIQQALDQGRRGLIYADITWGNFCELECVMCGPSWSHTWARRLGEQTMTWRLSRREVEQLAQRVRDCAQIEIKGGDPFNLPHFSLFLESLAGSSAQVKILSHFQRVTESHLEALAAVKNLSLGMSTEATGLLYQWIRGGDKTWTQAWQNLEKVYRAGLLQAEQFYFSSCLTVVNIEQWHRDQQQISEKFRELTGCEARWALNLVQDPQWLSPWLAAAEQRQQWYRELAERPPLGLDPENYRHITEQRQEQISETAVLERAGQWSSHRGITLEAAGVDLAKILGGA